MLSEVDRKIFRKLGIELTCDPVKKWYRKNVKALSPHKKCL
jgi:uncharacterized protein (UPF0371 family)